MPPVLSDRDRRRFRGNLSSSDKVGQMPRSAPNLQRGLLYGRIRDTGPTRVDFVRQAVPWMTVAKMACVQRLALRRKKAIA